MSPGSKTRSPDEPSELTQCEYALHSGGDRERALALLHAAIVGVGELQMSWLAEQAEALFGEALADVPGEAERLALHRRAALALAADARADELVPEIAHHWLAAGPGGEPAQAVSWARRAAEAAARVFAYEEAATWYRR